MITFVAELGIAAIANDPDTTMAVAVAAAIAAVMLRIAHVRAAASLPNHRSRHPAVLV